MNSDKLDLFAAAMAKAQAEMPAVPMDGRNPFYNSRYATLGAVIAATRPILAKHGFSVIQQVISNDTGDAVGIRTVILHTSGQFMSWESLINIRQGYTKTIKEANNTKEEKITYEGNAGQEAGKIATYLRRYSLAAALNLYSDEDIDANSPQQQQGKRKPNTQILTELGFEPMAVETAGKVTDSNGTPYIEIPSVRLRYMVGSINKAIKANGHDPEQLATLQDKQAAAKAILKARAEGAINEL